MIRLTIQRAGESCVVETSDAVVTLGRTRANTVPIDDEKASREHCRIERTAEGACKLIDPGSRNGTCVNGQRVSEHLLASGDQIRIGKTNILFELTEPAKPEPAPPQEPPDTKEPAAEGIQLVVAAGPDKGHTYEITAKLTTLGRQPRNDIVIDDRGVSNRHAQIRSSPDGFVLLDQGSRNGTLLNGKRVTSAALKHGDTIRIGNSTLRVVIPGAEATAAAVAPEPQPPPPAEEQEAKEEAAKEAPSRWPLMAVAAVVLVAAVAILALSGLLRTRHSAAPGGVPPIESPAATPLARIQAGPVTWVMDAPAQFSLANDGQPAVAAAGAIVVPEAATVGMSLTRGHVALGYPKLEANRCETRLVARLPAQDGSGPELTVHQTAAGGDEGLKLEYRIWTSEDAAVLFAGIELPVPAAVLPSLHVRTASGFETPAGGAFSLDAVYGLDWPAGGGRIFLASESALHLECRVAGQQAVLRLGQVDSELTPTPLVLSLTIKGTTAADEKRIAAQVAAAQRAARQGRLGEALRRFRALAEQYAHRRAGAELAPRMLDELTRRAEHDTAAALRLLERAKVTGRAEHFDAAQAALAATHATLRGSAFEARLVAALADCKTAGEAAGKERREAAATALLQAARRHQAAKEPHIARLHADEIRSQFPATAAAKKLQATSSKPQATSKKLRAASHEPGTPNTAPRTPNTPDPRKP